MSKFPPFLRWIQGALLVSSSVMVTACAGIQATPGLEASSLSGDVALKKITSTNWKLVTVQDGSGIPSARLKSGIAANHIRLKFDGNLLKFSGGCNRTFGNWSLPARDAITMGNFAATKKVCVPSLMQTDQEIIGYLQQMSRYDVNDKRLRLLSDAQVLTLVESSSAP